MAQASFSWKAVTWTAALFAAVGLFLGLGEGYNNFGPSVATLVIFCSVICFGGSREGDDPFDMNSGVIGVIALIVGGLFGWASSWALAKIAAEGVAVSWLTILPLIFATTGVVGHFLGSLALDMRQQEQERVKALNTNQRRNVSLLDPYPGMTWGAAYENYFAGADVADWEDQFRALSQVRNEALVVLRRDHRGQLWVFSTYRNTALEPGTHVQQLFFQNHHRVHAEDQVPSGHLLVVRS